MENRYYQSTITLRKQEHAVKGSKTYWTNLLYTDVAEKGMSLEQAKTKYNYSSYKKWGRKRFDIIYDSLIEIYNAKNGIGGKGGEIERSKQIVYMLIALTVGLVIAFVFVRLIKKKK